MSYWIDYFFISSAEIVFVCLQKDTCNTYSSFVSFSFVYLQMIPNPSSCPIYFKKGHVDEDKNKFWGVALINLDTRFCKTDLAHVCICIYLQVI